MKRPSLVCSAFLYHQTRTCVIGDQMQKDVRNWIAPPDPSKNYNIASEIYQTGTGVWFFQGGFFSEWRTKGTPLWIHGKRACPLRISVLWALMSCLRDSGFRKNISPVGNF